MERQITARLVAFCMAMAASISGCTLVRQTQDNNATQGRIVEKTDELQQATARQTQLQSQMQAFSDELASKRFTASQLDARLAVLQRQNEQLAAANAQKRAQREAVAKELASYRAQAAALQTSNTSDKATLDTQQRALDALTTKVRSRLAILAQSP